MSRASCLFQNSYQTQIFYVLTVYLITRSTLVILYFAKNKKKNFIWKKRKVIKFASYR